MALILKLQLLMVALMAIWTDLPLEQKGVGVAAAAMVLLDKTMTYQGTSGITIALGFSAMLVWIYAATLIMGAVS